MKKLLAIVFLLLLVFPLTTPFEGDIALADGPINLGFEPYDSMMHPEKPIVYVARLGSKTLYAVNYETGAINTVSLPYRGTVRKMRIYNDKNFQY